MLHSIVSRFGHPVAGSASEGRASGSTLPPHLHSPPSSQSYVLSIDFVEALEDLTKLLAADEGPIMLKLCEMQAVQRHLVPMLTVVTRARFPEALIFLLNILILLTQGDIEANRAPPEALLDCRRQYKRCFEQAAAMEALLALAVSCVRPLPETAAEDGELLGRVLALLSNLLAIPDAAANYVGANVALASAFGKHERLIMAMKKSRMLEFLMVAGASCNDVRDRRVFGPHVERLVEMFAHLLRVADPDEIAAMHDFDPAGPQRSVVEQAMQGEGRIRRPIRHSRFSGALVVRLSTGEDYMLAGSRLRDPLTLDGGKRVQHRPRRLNVVSVVTFTRGR